MLLVDYLKSPGEAFEDLKEKSTVETMKESLTVISIASVIFAVNAVIGLNIIEAMPLEIAGPELVVSIIEMGSLNLAAGMFFIVLLGGLFFGYIARTVMEVLGGSGSYWNGLSTVAYPVFAVGLGTLLAMISSYVPMIGPVLAFIFVAVFVALGYASMFRLAKEMFGVGMIEAFIGVTAILAVGLVALYGGLLTTPEGIMAVLP